MVWKGGYCGQGEDWIGSEEVFLISLYFSALSQESTEQEIVQKSQEQNQDNFGSEQGCVEMIEISCFII